MPPVSDLDVSRGGFYLLLARLLAAPPGSELLSHVASMTGGGGTPLEAALDAVARAVATVDRDALAVEYHNLFIGLPEGELLPYGSRYIAGFLHEKPLADLRGDMARLGIAADPDVSEPEDHIAALCDMMGGLILGHFAAPASLDEQRAFFDRHLASWVTTFFNDLKAAPSADFYRAVADLGRAFFDIEVQAFALA